jgi:DtxR family transcriptional regulator, Mn-dependent transcriptional regulator
MTPGIVALIALALAGLAFWPGRGLLARWREGQRLQARFVREDALKHILKSETSGQVPTCESVAGVLRLKPNAAARLLEDMEQTGLVSFDEGRLRLRPTGRELAIRIIRAHRLWESYLAEQTGVAEARWHLEAERQEHLLSAQQAEALAAQLGHPTYDPHGDPIPGAAGEFTADTGQPLNAAAPDTPVRITHIEDEPDTIYAQLCAEGLRPGMRAWIMEKTPQRIRFWADGSEHILAPILANNISVVPLPESKTSELRAEEYLSGLKPGRPARILGLSSACRGAERRRLLDLGFVPGTAIEVEMVSPGGDPTAYRLRGTVIALRRIQAGLIRISTTPSGTP